jgi:hypothetical protein
MLPNRISTHIPPDYNTLHVICKDIPGNTKQLKTMCHSDKQVFLPCIGKKFHVKCSAMVTDLSKACSSEFQSRLIIYTDIDKSPVDLLDFSRLCFIPLASVSLLID